jgi:hypothetical protein
VSEMVVAFKKIKFSTFFDYQFSKIAVAVSNIKKKSLTPKKIGQTFGNSI